MLYRPCGPPDTPGILAELLAGLLATFCSPADLRQRPRSEIIDSNRHIAKCQSAGHYDVKRIHVVPPLRRTSTRRTFGSGLGGTWTSHAGLEACPTSATLRGQGLHGFGDFGAGVLVVLEAAAQIGVVGGQIEVAVTAQAEQDGARLALFAR